MSVAIDFLVGWYVFVACISAALISITAIIVSYWLGAATVRQWRRRASVPRARVVRTVRRG